jgi:Ca2+-binding RTX toxin-like protein
MSDPFSIRRARTAALLAGLVCVLALAFAVPARADVSASFDPATGGLTVAGATDDDIAVTCQAGQVKVNGDDAIEPPLDCSSVVSLLVDIDSEQAGSNLIDLSGVSSAGFTRLTSSFANGDRGDDVIVGAAIADTITGGDGNDRITGFRGNDRLFGGNGRGDNDGADTLVWNDGDGSDVLDGEAGNDAVVVNGSAAAGDDFAITTNGARVRFERRNLTPFRLDIGGAETLQMNGGGGDDRITGSAGLAPLIKLRMNGGAGNDLLIGSDGDDVMDAGAGNDTMVCGAGRDIMAGNDGDDRMVWNNGDGSDVMDGDAGRDVAEVNGAPQDGDDFTVTPDGARVKFTRINLVPFDLDIATTEQLLVNAGGGADRIRPAEGLAALIEGAFHGQEGDDRLRGTDGADLLSGGPGNDTLRSKDRAADRVECDDGRDFARVDRRDSTRDCELRVGARPMVRLRGKVARVRGGVSLIRLRCVGVPRCGVSVKLRRGRAALGAGRLSLKGDRTARVRLNRRGRRLASKASPRGVKVALQISAQDTLGNGWRSTARLRLRR